jgi:hypothetical protein
VRKTAPVPSSLDTTQLRSVLSNCDSDAPGSVTGCSEDAPGATAQDTSHPMRIGLFRWFGSRSVRLARPGLVALADHGATLHLG